MSNHEHDHDEDETEEIETVTLEMENGTTEECEILDTVELDGKMYVALLPLDKDEYLIYECKVGTEQDEIEIINIQNPDEYEKVVHAFEELFEYEDDDEDDEDDDDED